VNSSFPDTKILDRGQKAIERKLKRKIIIIMNKNE
jgi:hypothetical protein